MLRLYTFAVVLGLAAPTYAEVVAVARSDTVTLSLTDEACDVPHVTNLKLKAVWTDSKGDINGCWGSQIEGMLIVIYFDDGSVMGVPTRAFQKVTGT